MADANQAASSPSGRKTPRQDGSSTPSGAASSSASAPNKDNKDAGNGYSAEFNELTELESDILKRLRQVEKRIWDAESEYIHNTLQGSSSTIGNIISGYEGLLEGKAPDKKKISERIFSDSSETWRIHRREVEAKKAAELAAQGMLPPGYQYGTGAGGGGYSMGAGAGGGRPSMGSAALMSHAERARKIEKKRLKAQKAAQAAAASAKVAGLQLGRSRLVVDDDQEVGGGVGLAAGGGPAGFASPTLSNSVNEPASSSSSGMDDVGGGISSSEMAAAGGDGGTGGGLDGNGGDAGAGGGTGKKAKRSQRGYVYIPVT